jgi:hypothetical protein
MKLTVMNRKFSGKGGLSFAVRIANTEDIVPRVK